MKKKISIVISLTFLLCIINSCEQEDQISSLKSIDHSISVDKNSMLPLQNRLITKDDVQEESCDDPVEVILYAGQHIEVGKIFISNSESKLFVTYDLTGSNWWLSETHLFAGDIDEAPFTNSGNPQIGKFPYHGLHDLTQEHTFAISLVDLDNPVSVIAHAVVQQREDGQNTSIETAFGYGDIEFQGNRWGWIINYEQQSCETSEDENDESSTDPEDTEESDDDPNIDYEDGCMDAYTYSSKQNSICLLNRFERWGWTNKVTPNDRYYIPGGVTYTYPLYASAYSCAIDNNIPVGEVIINISGGDGILYANITVNLSKQELSITDLDIYAGETAYPLDDYGDASIAFDEFDLNLDGMNVKTYTVNWLDWFDETNFILHVKVCPEEILQ